MTDYAYILSLFKTVLSASKSIKGKVYMGHRYGLQDINYDQLGQAITELKIAEKYPLVMLAPPHSEPESHAHRDGWEMFRIVCFFVTSTYYSNGQINLPDVNTRMSTETVISVWDDMKVRAREFLKKLKELNYDMSEPNKDWRIPPNKALIVPLSEIGADRVSGIRLDFDFELFRRCDEYTDY